MRNRGIVTFVALLCSALLFTASLDAKTMQAEVKKLDGWAEYALPGDDLFQPLSRSTKLPHGSKVRTAEGATVILRVVPGAAMQIDEKTTVTIDGMEFEKTGDKVEKRKARISLSSGTVTALLDHRDPEATDFRIDTPQGSAAARGTYYGVSVVEGQTFVKVQEGKVGVTEKSSDKADKPKSDSANK